MAELGCISLHKAFAGVSVLRGVSASWGEGICALIGPNGAGKTTLLDILTGFARPDRGWAWLDGSNIRGWSAERIARHGVRRLFQDLRLASTLGVADHLALSALSAPIAATAEFGHLADALLAVGGLEPGWPGPASELSFGQQKLLAMACLLLGNPTRLILDEPLTGLAPPARQLVLATLLELTRHGVAILMVEHDLGAVKAVASRITVLSQGQVLADGATGEVLAETETLGVLRG